MANEFKLKRTAAHAWARMQDTFDQVNERCLREVIKDPIEVFEAITFAEWLNRQDANIGTILAETDTDI